MDQPWYRQYFWLLVFGGIILFAGIISLVMVCVCRTQFSKRLTIRIQKSWKQKKKRRQERKNTVIAESYRPTAPPTVLLPEARPNLFDTNSEKSSLDLRHFMYATALKRPAPSQQLNPIPENTTSDLNHVTYATPWNRPARFQQLGLNPEYGSKKFNINVNESGINDRYSNASYDSVGQITDIYRIQAATEDPEYGGKKFNINVNESGINDRYSNASYDSVGQIANIYRIQAATEDPEYGGKKFNINVNESVINDRYSNASYDSVGQIANSYRIQAATEDSIPEDPTSDLYHITSATAQKRPARFQQLGLNPEYGSKKFNINVNQSGINDRYSNASYDSVGQIANIYRIQAATEDDTKNLEYVKVIGDNSDYDDVEII
ncbi:uncharacterized protein LOC135050869 [Pseudophryne corroboree]|uniref:uncharacterized protein LOC135050869 n=1 Tax=Pseudophryne corroboree TaxID=495146 RepID=UPI00308192EE